MSNTTQQQEEFKRLQKITMQCFVVAVSSLQALEALRTDHEDLSMFLEDNGLDESFSCELEGVREELESLQRDCEAYTKEYEDARDYLMLYAETTQVYG
jgi:hypothetical protein